jgi:hypothetical protein
MSLVHFRRSWNGSARRAEPFLTLSSVSLVLPTGIME